MVFKRSLAGVVSISMMFVGFPAEQAWSQVRGAARGVVLPNFAVPTAGALNGLTPTLDLSLMPALDLQSQAPRLDFQPQDLVLEAPETSLILNNAEGAEASPAGSMSRMVEKVGKHIEAGDVASAGTSVSSVYDGLGRSRGAVSAGAPALAASRDDAKDLIGPDGLPNAAVSILIPLAPLPGAVMRFNLTGLSGIQREALQATAKGTNGGYVILGTAVNYKGTTDSASLAKFSIVQDNGAKGMIVQVEATHRIRIAGVTENKGGLLTSEITEVMKDRPSDAGEVRGRLKQAYEAAQDFVKVDENIADVVSRAQAQPTPEAELATLAQILPTEDQHHLLEAESLEDRLTVFNLKLAQQWQKVTEQFGRQAASEHARGKAAEQSKTLEERIMDSDMPDEVKATVLEWFQTMEQNDKKTEQRILAALKFPWTNRTEDNLDLDHARQTLDAEHFGLEEVKERIMEIIAQRKRKKTAKGTVLVFAGPPGTGKTSIGSSIAKALGRKFGSMAVGGVSNESKIRGFSFTYQGSKVGMIADKMIELGTRNPVLVIDEIDKMTDSNGSGGDPKAAMLEVLDPQQNSKFVDNYLGLPLDLSDVIFIANANDLGRIPRPLLDRLEIIEFTSYTKPEKLEIAKRHLIRRGQKATGAEESEAVFTDDGLMHIIKRYTVESGVRNLGRKIEAVLRKIVAQAETQGTKSDWKIGPAEVEKLLGPPEVGEKQKIKNDVGVATGLAWTAVGGTVLPIEISVFPAGKGKIDVTGNLQQVMTESTKVALTAVRRQAANLGIDETLFNGMDIHFHVPEGATPKDGPSAGITLVTAITSRLTGRPVNPDVAMTGEVTTTGEVHAIGGLKEKVMGAYEKGYTTILFPKDNERDVYKIPAEVRNAMTLIPVSSVDQVLEHALLKEATQEPMRAPRAAASPMDRWAGLAQAGIGALLTAGGATAMAVTELGAVAVSGGTIATVTAVMVAGSLLMFVGFKKAGNSKAKTA